MDVITELLGGVRARGADFCQSIASPPWSLRFTAPPPLTVAAVVRGEAWVTPDGGRPVRLAPGDAALVKGPSPYVVADSPTTRPTVFVHGPGRYDGPPGDPLISAPLAPRTYGTADGECLVLSGHFPLGGEVCTRLLSALPPLAVVPSGDRGIARALELVQEEITGEGPGRQVVLDRLLELMLVLTVRLWFDRQGGKAPGWYTALTDPAVGRALRLMHDDPARPWTVAALAGEAGMSRAAFARRFSALAGQPPLAYLTEWRMALAADLLSGAGLTVAAAARRVGYADPFGFSAAFKRVRGVSPGSVRAAAPS
ncbi:AraC-type DNA-binding protein [Sinosporangium album]|uniref:AraC-type DNA-binding protein n=1 Tax=Sinosporangium album TaxID=504805 RepID=A0A1G7WRF6_9ACTN|nr:AraC family transcriptional regulator [Sinosporangium album]SDG74509.1 AraC-type DNA-binding protein [Sinosporangium album]